MSSARAARVLVSQDDIELIEAGAFALQRERKSIEAVRLLAFCLRLRSEVGFACHVDESAGMAEVVELQQWSTKV